MQQMRTSIKIACLLLIYFNAFTQTLAQNKLTFNPELGNFFVKNYTRSMLNSTAGHWSLLQDRDGVIYIGNTSDGTIIYDGQRLSHVMTDKGEIKKGLTRSLIIDSKDIIYTSIGGLQFGYIEKNKYGESIYHSLSDKLPPAEELKTVVWGIEIHNDTVFVQSEKIIYLFKDKKLLKTYHFQHIVHHIEALDDAVYLRVWEDGLYRYTNGAFKLIPASVPLFANTRIDAMYVLKTGEHLLVSRNTGLWLMKKDDSIEKVKSDEIDQYAIKGEAYIGNQVLKNGIIPMSTGYAGMVFFDQNYNLAAVINESNGTNDEHVSYYLQDRAGDIWAATTSDVFKTSFDTSLTFFSTINNVRGGVDYVRRINGKIYIRTDRDLYYLQAKKNLTEKSIFKPLGINELGSSVISFKNQIITTNNYTIKSTVGNNTTLVSKLYRCTQSIQSKLNPDLLFTANYAYGLTIHENKNNTWRQLNFPTQDTVLCVRLEEPVPGKIILTTRDGLYTYSYDKSGAGTYKRIYRDKAFTTKDIFQINKFNDNDYLVYDTLRNFYSVDLENNKLVYTGYSLKNITQNDNWAYTYNPASGNGWISTITGIYKIQYNRKTGFKYTQYPFYKADLSELSSGIYAEGEGDQEVVWLGSQDQKLYRFIPEIAAKESHNNYKCLIRSVVSNGEKMPLNINKIPFDKNNIIFEVAYPVFGNEQKTQFNFWLEGQDKSWSGFTLDSKKEYTNLNEGNYILHVQAKDASGQLSEETTLSFKISPPWYRSILAYLCYLILLIFSFVQFGKLQAKKSLKKAEDDRKNSELAAAKELQNRLLPKKLPNINGLDIAGFLRTSTEVGGDYYDFFEQPDGSLYAICGDATGHGTPSGMLVSITKAGIIGLPQLPPNEMLHKLNRVVKKVDLGILRMSLNIAYVKNDDLYLSSAGMPPYFIFRKNSGNTEEIMLSGVPLGSFNDVTYDQIQTTFKIGDVLVIISDGLPEAPDSKGQLFDYVKVQNLITDHAHHSAQEIIDVLMQEADKWLSGKHNPDDITLVVIKKI
jgi:Arg-Lys translocation region protein phosphatase